MAVVWCDPPSAGRSRWMPMLEEITERADTWALMRVYDKSNSAYHARTYLRDRAEKPEGQWDYHVGRVEPDEPGWGLWAKWEPSA